MRRHKKRRIPALRFTKNRGIGWHVNFRDPVTGVPRRHRFAAADVAEATKLHATWVAAHLNGTEEPVAVPRARKVKAAAATASAVPGSLVHVASNYLRYEERRSRKLDDRLQAFESRRRSTRR